MTIYPKDDGFLVSLYEAIDPRDPKFVDIVEFQSTTPEPDDPVQETTCETEEAALEQARAWGADPARFVNGSMVGHEYEDYLAKVMAQAPSPG